MERVRAPQVRNSLAVIIGSLPTEGFTTKKIIAVLRKEHSKAIETDTADLIEIALVKLVSQVGALRSSSTPDLQPELFAEYTVKKRLCLIVETPQGTEKVWKNRDDITVAEADRYVAQHERAPVKLSANAKEVRRLLSDVRAHAKSPNDRLVDAWIVAQAAKK